MFKVPTTDFYTTKSLQLLLLNCQFFRVSNAHAVTLSWGIFQTLDENYHFPSCETLIKCFFFFGKCNFQYLSAPCLLNAVSEATFTSIILQSLSILLIKLQIASNHCLACFNLHNSGWLKINYFSIYLKLNFYCRECQHS